MLKKLKLNDAMQNQVVRKVGLQQGHTVPEVSLLHRCGSRLVTLVMRLKTS